jgi:Family of unknown function (DUF6152)
MKLKLAGYVVSAIVAFVIQAQAHHSFAMFDHDKAITVSGTLKEFEFTNPHCWLHVSVVDPTTGRTLDWAFEMGSVGQIAAQGWKADTVKLGDKITIEAHPMKDGSRGGQYMSATLSDGRTLKQAPNPNPNNAAR